MNAILFYILAILFASQTKIGVTSAKYDQINDCNFQNIGSKYGDDKITFICADNNRESSIFVERIKFKCSNSNGAVEKKWVGTIDFKGCRFREIPLNFFETFYLLREFNASDLELEMLQLETFKDAKNLTYLDVTQNQLTEIPRLLFFNTAKLTYVDFSNNRIERIDPLAFEGAKHLQSLNFSNNRINHIDSKTFSTPNVLLLDLSKNNLTNLAEHIFDNMTNLVQLNLSFNPIGNLSIEIFAHLLNLEDVNLKRANITSIQLGTFSHQHKLTSLDLSENNLLELDFSHFLPILPELRSFYLNGNHLTHLDGFENALFPQLALLDIRDNRFNCSYLQRFMKSVNWEKLRLPIDRSSVKPGETSMRGIKCETISQNKTSFIEKLIETPIQNKNASDNNKDLLRTIANFNKILNTNICIMNILLTIICITLLAFFILFVVTNRDRIHSKLYTVSYKNQPNEKPSTAETTVAFTNHSEKLLIQER